MSNTLFGELASKFVLQTENLATESLNFILRKSPIARQAFSRLIKTLEPRIEEHLIFRTQVSDTKDSAIPDLIGFNQKGVPVCVVEAKFWAALTDHQPVSYLKRLNEGHPSTLLFLAPQKRVPKLWLELLERLHQAEISFQERTLDDGRYRFAEINSLHSIGIITWDSLLQTMYSEVQIEGDTSTKSDLEQLIGLCERIDSEAFLPLESEEVGPDTPKRLIELTDLVDDLTNMGIEKGLFNISGLKATSTRYGYQRYLRIGPTCGASLRIDLYLWYNIANTPFWLQIIGPEWRDTDAQTRRNLKERLSPLKFRNPPKYFDFENETVVIPLYVKTEVEKQKLLDYLMGQILEVGELVMRER